MPTPTTCCSHSYDSEEVRHSHMRYALKNIPRTKIHQYNNRKRCAAKIKMGLGGFHDAKSVSPVRSNIACLCDLQTTFMWLLRAKGTAVIDLNLIDSFSMVENTPQPEWTQHIRSFWCPEIVHEEIECRRLVINLTIRITCCCSRTSGLWLRAGSRNSFYMTVHMKTSFMWG